ncbi:helix-turn-helix domain-containing protein [Sphingobium sp. B11D3A]|uniref:helix-turn-helix domain-containing protein n=1 Tax=Sphingobium sp. B11D3A TaxID=2940574 RepID=UPI002224352E|nr:helix-turn-helix domain-containing protein [Sphingobium sp. B11D3A]MCW2393543.1 DNA-binding winged helix-turn-helix (wHTH) protein [Sphingobium sp. B11D3A]
MMAFQNQAAPENGALFNLAMRLRELASRGTDADAAAYIDIAEALHRLAQQDANKTIEGPSREFSPLDIRRRLRLRFPKSGLLLHHVARQPDQLFSHDTLIAELDTTISGLRIYIFDIRQALTRWGVPNGLITISGQGYLFTRELLEKVNKILERDNGQILPENNNNNLEGDGNCFELCGDIIDQMDYNRSLENFIKSERPGENIADLSISKSDRLVLLLASRQGEYVSCEEILENVRTSKGSLKVLMHRIRGFFAELGYPRAISSSYGRGYCMSQEAATFALSASLTFSVRWGRAGDGEGRRGRSSRKYSRKPDDASGSRPSL